MRFGFFPLGEEREKNVSFEFVRSSLSPFSFSVSFSLSLSLKSKVALLTWRLQACIAIIHSGLLVPYTPTRSPLTTPQRRWTPLPTASTRAPTSAYDCHL